MKTNRRQFVKLASGLMVPAVFTGIGGIIRAGTAPSLQVAGTARVGTLSRPAGGGGGPDAWYDIQDPAGADGDNIGFGNTAYVWQAITIPQGGTCTKLRAYYTDSGGAGVDIKMALYDNSGNLLTSGGPVSFVADGWHEVTVTSQAVTATTYRIALEVSAAGAGMTRLSSSGAFTSVTLGYASFPESTMSGGSGPFTSLFCWGMYVD